MIKLFYFDSRGTNVIFINFDSRGTNVIFINFDSQGIKVKFTFQQLIILRGFGIHPIFSRGLGIHANKLYFPCRTNRMLALNSKNLNFHFDSQSGSIIEKETLLSQLLNFIKFTLIPQEHKLFSYFPKISIDKPII